MLEEAYKSPIEYTREILSDILDRRFQSCLPTVRDSYYTVCLSIRYGLLNSKEQLATTWNGIRIDPALVDFILDVTRELMIRGFESQGFSFDYCVELIAKNHGMLSSADSSIDSDLLATMPSQATYKYLLLNNPWLLTLYLSETILAPGNKDE